MIPGQQKFISYHNGLPYKFAVQSSDCFFKLLIKLLRYFSSSLSSRCLNRICAFYLIYHFIVRFLLLACTFSKFIICTVPLYTENVIKRLAHGTKFIPCFLSRGIIWFLVQCCNRILKIINFNLKKTNCEAVSHGKCELFILKPTTVLRLNDFKLPALFHATNS